MSYRHLLVVAALGAGEVAAAALGVCGDDGGLVVVVGVAALLALLAVGDDRAPVPHHDPAVHLYRQRVTSSGDSGPLRARFYPMPIRLRISEQRGLSASRKPSTMS